MDAGETWPAFSHRLVVAISGSVAALVRLVTHSYTPLLWTPDSIAYFQMALDWRDRASWELLLPFRTPVFPVVLGEVLRLGASPVVITTFQAVIGVLTAMVVAALGCRIYDTVG